MKPLFAALTLFTATFALAAEEPVPSKPDEAAAKPDVKETMKARMLEDAKRKAAEAAKTPAPATVAKSAKDSKLPAALTAPAKTPASPPPEKPPAKKAEAAAANAQAAAQPAAVLPKVEVKKARVTVLDVQLAEQQREIAREEKLTKPTQLDKALNDSKVAQKLSILGGQSADYRAGLAQERVNMMKEESDLIEAIAHAKTKAERAELQKQLEELRAYRRDLEKARR
jgi:hypothetical protein